MNKYGIVLGLPIALLLGGCDDSSSLFSLNGANSATAEAQLAASDTANVSQASLVSSAAASFASSDDASANNQADSDTEDSSGNVVTSSSGDAIVISTGNPASTPQTVAPAPIQDPGSASQVQATPVQSDPPMVVDSVDTVQTPQPSPTTPDPVQTVQTPPPSEPATSDPVQTVQTPPPSEPATSDPVQTVQTPPPSEPATSDPVQTVQTPPPSEPATSDPVQTVQTPPSSEPVTQDPVQPPVINAEPRSFFTNSYFSHLDLSNKVYYVDSGSSGNDSNPGTANAPFKTIQYAINKVRQNPDHDVIVRDGSYRETIVINGVHGSGDDPVVIRSESKWGVTFNAIGLTRDQGSVIEVVNSSHVKVGGFFVNGSRGFGILVENSSNILFKENKTYNTGHSGIKGRSSDYVDYLWNDISRHVQVGGQEGLSIERHNYYKVIGNKVHDRPNRGQAYSLQSDYLLTYPYGIGYKDRYENCFAGDPYDFEAMGKIRMDGCSILGGEAIDVKVASSHGEVAYNIVDGVEGKFGIYLDAWGISNGDGSELIQEDIDVHHNIVMNSGSGFSFSVENGSSEKGKLRDIRVYDNISFNNDGAGIALGDFGGDGNTIRPDKVRRVEDMLITNNIIVGNTKHGLWLANPNTKNIIVKDNVIGNNSGKQAYFSDPVNQNSPSTLKYILTDNIIDTTNRDYSWVKTANIIQELPDATLSNGYLTDVPVVTDNGKGVVNDVGTLVDTLGSQDNG